MGSAVDPARARELATPIDGAMPFVPWMIYIYLCVFPAALMPVFVVRSPRLFRRTVLAYAIAIIVSLVVFVLWPVTSLHLRADPAAFDRGRFTDWCLSLVYEIDPPVNLFPSLHLSIAALAAGALWKARRVYGAAAIVLVLAIGISISAVKQHFLVDGVGGLVLAAGIYAVVLRPFRPAPGEPPAGYPWQGPALYLVFQAAVFAALFGVFLLLH